MDLERQICSCYKLTADNCTVQDLVRQISLHITEISVLARNMANTLLGTV